MGLGIAFVAAKVAGVQVLIADNSEAQIAKGFAFIDKLLIRDVSKGKMTQDEADATKSRIKSVKSIEEFGNCDLAIEVSEIIFLSKCKE